MFKRIIIIALIVIAAVYFLGGTNNKSVEVKEKEIDFPLADSSECVAAREAAQAALESANYCQASFECGVFKSMELGCSRPINSQTDKKILFEKVEEIAKKCGQVELDCVDYQQTLECVEGKCVILEAAG